MRPEECLERRGGLKKDNIDWSYTGYSGILFALCVGLLLISELIFDFNSFLQFWGVVIFEGAASLALRRLLALLVGSLLGSNEVDGRTSLEEINLVGRHGVSGSEVVGRAVRLGSSHLDKATVVTTLLKHVQEVQGLQSVAGLDLVVVGLVLKGQRKHTLLLEVGLVNSSERLD